MLDVIGWITWIATSVFALLLLRVVFDRGRPDRHRETVLLAAILFGLVVTLWFNVSRLHLLWFIPLVVAGTCLTPNSRWPDDPSMTG